MQVFLYGNVMAFREALLKREAAEESQAINTNQHQSTPINTNQHPQLTAGGASDADSLPWLHGAESVRRASTTRDGNPNSAKLPKQIQ